MFFSLYALYAYMEQINKSKFKLGYTCRTKLAFNCCLTQKILDFFMTFNVMYICMGYLKPMSNDNTCVWQRFSKVCHLLMPLLSSILMTPGSCQMLTCRPPRLSTFRSFRTKRTSLRFQQIVNEKALPRPPKTWQSRRETSHIPPGTALNRDHPGDAVTQTLKFPLLAVTAHWHQILL